MEDILGSPILVALFGLIAPFVISFLKDPRWGDSTKQVVTIIVAVAFGVLSLWLRIEPGDEPLEWDLETILGHVAAVGFIAVSLYKLFFQGTDTNRDLENAGPGPGSNPPGALPPD